MMWALLVLLALSGAWADECCSTEDKREVLRLWNDIWSAEFSGRRVTVAQAVFADIFENDAGAKDLFQRVNVDEPDSAEFKAHCVRVINGLDTAIQLLESPKTLDIELDHLAAQHAARDGVTQSYFKLMGEAFMRVMPQVSECFNPSAFKRCYKRIAERISRDLPE